MHFTSANKKKQAERAGKNGVFRFAGVRERDGARSEWESHVAGSALLLMSFSRHCIDPNFISAIYMGSGRARVSSEDLDLYFMAWSLSNMLSLEGLSTSVCCVNKWCALKDGQVIYCDFPHKFHCFPFFNKNSPLQQLIFQVKKEMHVCV